MSDPKENKEKYDKVAQLRSLIKGFKNSTDVRIDIFGVILDYVGETGVGLEGIFGLNHKIYTGLFVEGNVETKYNAHILLKSLLPTKDDQITFEKYHGKSYPEIGAVLKEFDVKTGGVMGFPGLPDPDTLVGFKVAGIVWQLSDIHFGSMNKTGLDPIELAETLCRIVDSNKKYLPKVIIVSGDITSDGSEEDYKEFRKFIGHLNKRLWGAVQKYRILVIPGNHDIRWLKDGTADRMKQFIKYFVKSRMAITPFGRKEEESGDGNVTVNRIISKKKDVPPIALVTYKDLELQFLLLVSAYYSGTVPKEVRDIISGLRKKKISDALKKILRIDKGEITHSYIDLLSSEIKELKFDGIAVTHHHLCEFGAEPCKTEYANELLRTLAEKGIYVVLHGHTHMVEDKRFSRLVTKSLAFPVPCSSLGGECVGTHNRGFSLHFIGNPEDKRRIATFLWPIGSTNYFTPKDLFARYWFRLSKDGIELES